jgi:chromosome segregation protein
MRELLCARFRAGRPAGARAGDREPRAPAARAGADRRRGARSALVRAEAAYTEASLRLVARAPRGRRGADPRPSAAGGTAAPDAAGRAASARSGQLDAELAEVDAQLDELQERRVTGEARFEELDMQLADTQERHAELDERVIAAERAAGRLPRAAARAGAPGAGGAVPGPRAWPRAAASCSAPSRRRNSRWPMAARPASSCELELGTPDDAAAQAGLQGALALKLEREQALGARAASTTTCRPSCAPATSSAAAVRAQPGPAARAHHQAAAQGAGRAAGRRAYLEQLAAPRPIWPRWRKSIAEGNVKLWGPAGRDRPHPPRDHRAGRVNLAALDELTTARERKTFLDAQSPT